MTPARFAELVAKLSGPPGRAREAAYYQLVDGHTQAESARLAGITAAAVARCADRIRELDQQPVCPACGQVVK
jgi:DNA-directed RNA polymerase specialized sigma24 family protein